MLAGFRDLSEQFGESLAWLGCRLVIPTPTLAIRISDGGPSLGLLRGYDDAELTLPIGPRHLIIEAGHHPAGGGTAPGRTVTPGFDQVTREAERTQ